MAGSAFDTKVKNYVFTHNPPQSAAPAGVEFVKEPSKAFAARLRGKNGKDIWMMGGAGIIRSFLDEGEIDEFVIHVIPTFRRRHSIDRAPPSHCTTKTDLLDQVHRRRGQTALCCQ